MSSDAIASCFEGTNSFVPVHVFHEKDNPLPKEVESDHAQIAATLPGNTYSNIIKAENVNNPSYAHYFCAAGHPFSRTHLSDDSPFEEESASKKNVFKKKHLQRMKNQAERICSELQQKNVTIWIIVEGSKQFCALLEEMLENVAVVTHEKEDVAGNDHPSADFLIVTTKKSTDTGNMTLIVINTGYYKILKTGSQTADYEEYGRSKTLVLPYAVVLDPYLNKHFLVAGVHVSGCDNQYPEAGLKFLSEKLLQLQNGSLHSPDVIAGGDFNTPAHGVQKAIIDNIGNHRARLLNVDFFTHINPYGLACTYDHFLVITPDYYNPLPLDAISYESRAFVNSMKRKL